MESKQETKHKRSVLSKSGRIFAWILASVIFLVFLVLIFIQTPFVQNYARKKIVIYLENKLKTKVEIGKLDVEFPTSISLQNIFLEDQSKDTLLYGGEIKLRISMFRLLKNDFQVKEIALNNIVAKVKKSLTDSVFNFQFIADAFASGKEKVSTQKDSTSFKMNIERILLNNTRIIYQDASAGNDMGLSIGHLDTQISTFDPSHLLFNIQSVTLKGLSGYFYKSGPSSKSLSNSVSKLAAEPANYLQLINKEMNLSDINVVYKNEPSHLNSSFIINHFVAHPEIIDLKNNLVLLKDATLMNSDITIETASNKTNPISKDSALADASSTPFRIISDKITIGQSSLKYDDQFAPHITTGMDYSHLYLSDISLSASKLEYSPDTILASINSASLKEQNGFVLNNLKVDFGMNPTGVSLTNLLLTTPGSEIKNSAIISYPSLDTITKDPGLLGLNIDLQNSKITIKDLLTFVPQLKTQTASLPPNSTLYIDGIITGKVNNLNFKKLIIKGLNATNINATGVVQGLPNLNKLYTDLKVIQFHSSQKDILLFLPKNTLPNNITLPESISASGIITGSINDLYTDITLNSDLGDAKVKGTFANINDQDKARYDLSANATNLQLSTIMQNPKLGLLTGNLTINGNSFNPQTANATFKINVENITLNNYNYKNIKAKGSIANKIYKISASVLDPNLDAHLTANGELINKFPAIYFNATIDSIKTFALHLTAGTNIYHGDIKGDFANTDPDNLAGNLLVTHSIIINNGQRIAIDSISLGAENDTKNKSLTIKTDFLSASIKGTYKLTQLADVFQQSVNPYFSFTDKKNNVTVEPYYFSLTATIIDNPALQVLFPQITQFSPINLSGNFSSDSGFNMSAEGPHIVFGTSTIDSINLMTNTKNGTLIFNVSLRRLQSGSSFSMYATTLYGKIKNNNIDFTLNIKDENAKNKYNLSGNINQPVLNKYILSLTPTNLVLNYNKWTAGPDNTIQYFNNDLNAHNFVLSQGTQELSINSAGMGINEPMQINFKNFKIENITGFIQNDSLMVAGLLDGNVLVKNIQAQPTFTTDITITNLSVYQDTLGTLTAKVNNNLSNTYHADINLKGYGNEVNINGDYFVKSTNSSYNFIVDIASLQMKSLEGFTKGEIKNSRGNMYGKVSFNGSLENPDINGKIQFNNTAFNVSALNNLFKIDKEAIAIINNKGIELNSFTIRDTANNAITIDGVINTKDYLNYGFGLKVKARNFQAINSSSTDNPLFYGKMVFSTDLTIEGTPGHPIVNGDLTINDKTNFTLVLPQSQQGIESRKGIVRFVNKDATAEDSLFTAPYDSLTTSSLRGYDISLNIKVVKEAIFNVVVDAGNGDFLRLKGTGQLTAGIDANGKMTLVGSYDIEEGSYDLSFNFLKRKFLIQKGSSIVWTGEPTTAKIDITALYIANTAPIDLVQEQVNATNSDINIYKQKLPFEVHLLLQGELLKPQINFDIILPKDKNYNVSDIIISTVQTKLAEIRQEPGEMNKQVFALLLLNRFIGEDPFNNSGGSANAGTIAMQSVSKLLTQQLNQLAQNLVQGVDINFDVATTQDYTTGSEQNRTDVNVGISKRLLSDRLTVTVGSDFQLQGPMQTNQQNNNVAGNISVNYKLSKDGKYMLRAYRKNDYSVGIEGYVIETGIGFIISVDYNKFKEIFSTKEQRLKKRKIKEANKNNIQTPDSSYNGTGQPITTPLKTDKNKNG
ncbi:MAG: translocation/assembly module TamB domain-containing protein [Bacteroidota bacterium]|nr:translocation/assembly module TamB domain-containing protein [Bacteroidota bacterium]